MSFPASLTARTVSGGFVTHPDGQPARGSVRIVLNNFMQGPTDNLFVVPFDVTIELQNGRFSTVLPATNDPQWTSSYYRIVVSLWDRERRESVKKAQYSFTVPYDSNDPLDLTDLVNVPLVSAPAAYVLLSSKGAPGGVASLASDGKVPLTQLPASVGGDILWDDVQNKPSTFPPSTHTHAFADVTGKPTTYPPSTHDHEMVDVVGLSDALQDEADLVGGVVPTGQIPSISVIDFLGNKASQAAMLGTSGQKGDWVIRTDLGQAYVITDTDPSVLSSWTALPIGVSPVTSVNDQVGIVVLGKADVGLPNVNNTSDANKPISTAQQTALDGKASTSDLTTGLAGKANTSHVHSAIDITSGTLVTGRGGTGLSSFTASAYLRASSTTALEFRSASQVLADIGAAASTHSHAISDVTNLSTTLAGKSDTTHTHAFADITGKPSTYPHDPITWTEITDKPTTFPSDGSVAGDLVVEGYTGLHGGAQIDGDLVVEGYTSLQGLSLLGDLEVANIHVLGVSYLDGESTTATASAGNNSTRIATTAFVNTAIAANGPKILVLEESDSVPGGTPAGTVIIRIPDA